MTGPATGCTDAMRQEMAALSACRETGPDRFRIDPFPNGLLRLYGGQITAQALGAAQRTVAPDRPVHSCHAYFGAPGRTDLPLALAVTRDRDGRSFASRRVVVEQAGELLMTLSASFHQPEGGVAPGPTMPEGLPDPDKLPSLVDAVRGMADRLPARHHPFWLREGILDWRPVEAFRFVDPPTGAPTRDFWFRSRCPLGDDPAEHRRVLAYASDLHILHTAMGPLGEPIGSDLYQTSSLDHAIWFHAACRVDEWLLYRTTAIAAGDARALGGGTIFARDGRQVATVMQEGLARLLAAPRADRL